MKYIMIIGNVLSGYRFYTTGQDFENQTEAKDAYAPKAKERIGRLDWGWSVATKDELLEIAKEFSRDGKRFLNTASDATYTDMVEYIERLFRVENNDYVLKIIDVVYDITDEVEKIDLEDVDVEQKNS